MRRTGRDTLIPSPNIWNWPDVYARENHSQDSGGAIWAALREVCPWDGLDVLDVGCGDGYHLPVFAESARSVVGVEPHSSLVALARRRVAGLPDVRVLRAPAQRLPLPDASVDLVHARTAYFFGPGCEPGLAQARRVLRPGGAIAIVDLDATRTPYGGWLRADLPAHYDPAAVEAFFDAQGFELRRIETLWSFAERRELEAVLRIEFSPAIAARAIAATPGLTVQVGYRLHVWRRRILAAGIGILR